MPVKNRWLIYGAYGYSGELIAREAVHRGLNPVLGGRDAARVAELAAGLGCRHRAFALDDQSATFQALEDVRIVLNCAGPFEQTAQPMMHACLAAKAHYVDITGEIAVFEMARELDERAQRAGLVVCPGVGFDVVATDCVAAVLQEALPRATYLALGFDTRGGPSPGTTKTMIRGLRLGGRIRSAGALIEVPLAFRERRIDFGHGPRNAVTIPWGDVSTAWHTTRIPNIEVYVPMSRSTVRVLRVLGAARGLLALGAVRRAVERRFTRGLHGPDEVTRAGTPVYVWGEVRDAAGEVRVARMRTANGYTFTAHAASGVVAELLARPHTPGFVTPSLLMGAGYAASLPGSTEIVVTAA